MRAERGRFSFLFSQCFKRINFIYKKYLSENAVNPKLSRQLTPRDLTPRAPIDFPAPACETAGQGISGTRHDQT
jgi:hypothetical protein